MAEYIIIPDERSFAETARRLKEIPGAIDRAMPAAVNKTLAKCKTHSARRLVTVLHLPSSFVKKGLKVQRATRGNPGGAVKLTGRAIPLSAYPNQDVYPGGVEVEGSPDDSVFPHAFIRNFKSGHRAVLERDAPGGTRVPRKPIHEVRSESGAELFRRAPAIIAEELMLMKEDLKTQLASQADRILADKKAEE